MAGVSQSQVNHQLNLDTRNCCFFCLQFITINEDENSQQQESGDDKRLDFNSRDSSITFQKLCHYLKIDLEGLLGLEGSQIPPPPIYVNDSSTTRQNISEVSLCNSCRNLSFHFGKLFEQLEEVQMKMNYFLRRIHEEIAEAYENPERVHIYSKRMTSDVNSLNNLVFIDKLRKQISSKCSYSWSNSQPNVRLTKLPSPSLQHFVKEKDLATSFPNQIHQTNLEIEATAAAAAAEVPIPIQIMTIKSETEKNQNKNPSTENDNNSNSSPNPSSQSTIKTPEVVLGQHYHKNKETGLFHCSSCSKTFKEVYITRTHYEAEHLGLRHYCPDCNKSFKCFGSLTSHRRKHHGLNPSQLRRCSTSAASIGMRKTVFNPKTGNYSCPLCSKEFPSRHSCKYHFNYHHLKIEYECQICNVAVFTTSHNLKLHQTICTGIPSEAQQASILAKKKTNGTAKAKLGCEICGKLLSSRCTLTEHKQLVHFKVCNYSCKLCKLKFKRVADLNDHIDLVHHGKKFVCDICHNTKEFTTLRRLKEHKKMCSSERRGRGKIDAVATSAAFVVENNFESEPILQIQIKQEIVVKQDTNVN